jgi:hypothetical protein
VLLRKMRKLLQSGSGTKLWRFEWASTGSHGRPPISESDSVLLALQNFGRSLSATRLAIHLGASSDREKRTDVDLAKHVAVGPVGGRARSTASRAPPTAPFWAWWNDGQSIGWTNLGGTISEQPNFVSMGADRIDGFARGADGALWQYSVAH